MKKTFILIGLLTLLTLIIIGIFKIVRPQKPQGMTEYIPLGIGVYNSDNVEFFNKHARDNDHISARPQAIDLLDNVETGEKSLVFGKDNDPVAMISLAETKEIEIIAYNLEAPLSKEELVAKEKEVYELAKENGLLFVFAPTVFNLEKYYEDFAQYADVIGLQSQRYQLQEDYEEVVEGLVGKIKSANPKVKVWVQVSVNPPGNREITADEVIQNIQAIQDKADSIRIFFGDTPDRTLVMEEVFKKLRTSF